MNNKKWATLYGFSCSLIIIIILVVYKSGLPRTMAPTVAGEVHEFMGEPVAPTLINKTVAPTLVDKTVVPIAAYVDARPLHSHKSSVVILVAVLNKHVSNIKGCEVDGRREMKKIQARPIATTWWIQKVHPKTHTELILTCYDMPANQKSSVSVLFSLSGRVMRVPVRRPGVLMPSKGKERDQVMVCCTGYGTPANLDEWLTYQQTIKVQHIHLNVEESFLQNVNKSNTLKRMLESGYVQMEVWAPHLSEEQVFLYSQSFKYQDCIFRYQNIYKYMMIIDFDEYFIPLGLEKDVNSYAKRLLSRRNLGSVELMSIRYYCKVKGHKIMSLPKDGNVTVLYDTSYSATSERGAGKSIHIVKFVEETSVHIAVHLLPGHRQVTYSILQAKCYIFHVTARPFYTEKCPH